ARGRSAGTHARAPPAWPGPALPRPMLPRPVLLVPVLLVPVLLVPVRLVPVLLVPVRPAPVLAASASRPVSSPAGPSAASSRAVQGLTSGPPSAIRQSGTFESRSSAP